MHAPDERPELPGTPLTVPVPPRLAETFGYPGACRFVAFYWEPAGDSVVFEDGRLSGTGDGPAFRLYARHPKVAPHLAPYDLGSGDGEAGHWLLIDRRRELASIAPREDAYRFLKGRRPPAPDLAPQEGEDASGGIRAALDLSAWREVTIDPQELRRRLHRQRHAEAALRDYLDHWQPAEEARHMEKTYTGYRDPNDRMTCHVLVQEEGGAPRELPTRLDLANRSPTGLSWGYAGSGPSQLALALACDVLGDDEEARDVYQQLKFRLVAGLPEDGWSLSAREVLEAIRQLQREQDG